MTGRARFITIALMVLIAAALLLIPAWYNGFPLVDSDSGAYIHNAIALYVPKDRPLTYSLFLRLSSAGSFLWLSIFVQSVLLSWLLLRTWQLLHSRPVKNRQYLILTALLVAVSGVSWFSAQLMPDIFTPMVFLASLLVLLSEQRKERWFLLFVLWGALMMHNANLVTALLFDLILVLLSLKNKWLQVRRARIWQLCLVTVLGWTSICSENLIAGHGFVPSQSGHVFIMGKMAENGILRRYLDEHCPAEDLKLCAYKDQFPMPAWTFIWEGKGPFMYSGGWDSSKKEYDAIIKTTLKDPHYLSMHLRESIYSSAQQLCLAGVSTGLRPFGAGSSPCRRISEHYPQELPSYMAARQQKDQLHPACWTTWYSIMIILIPLLALVRLYLRKNKDLLLIWCLCLLFVVLNAATTASLANVVDRLNARAVWLMIWMSLVILSDARSRNQESNS